MSDALAEPLMDANGAAEYLRVPRKTVYELCRSSALPHVKIGRRTLRFVRADLSAWVDANSYGTRAA